jgi:hypothetical protein
VEPFDDPLEGVRADSMEPLRAGAKEELAEELALEVRTGLLKLLELLELLE